MNILLYIEKEFNFLPDIIYHGLMASGHRVVDSPAKPSYHGVNHDPADQGRSMLCFNFPQHEHQEPYDLILIDVRYNGPINYSNFNIIDGNDYQYVRQDLYDRCHLYFKRELTQVLLEHYPKCRALPFASLHQEEYIQDKSMPFSFMLSGTVSTRISYYQALVNLEHEIQGSIVRYSDNALYPVNYAEYCENLRRSKASISLKGMGEDTYRYWEIPSYSTVLCARRPEIIIPDDFTDTECIRFDNEDDLINKLRYYLRDHPGELEQVRRQGYDKLMNYHTSVKRAEYLLRSV